MRRKATTARWLAALAALALLGGTAAAADGPQGVGGSTVAPGKRPPAFSEPPDPPDPSRSFSALAHARGADWIIATHAGPEATAIARAAGARSLAPRLGLWSAPVKVAPPLVERLRARELVDFVEADVPAVRNALPQDPLSPTQYWEAILIRPDLVPPPITEVERIGFIETGADLSHPDLNSIVRPGGAVVPPDEHGTAVASVAVGAANGVGVVGLWPNETSVVYPAETCAETVNALYAAAQSPVIVVNMSYGFPAAACKAHYVASQYAFGLGTILVAAAGNEAEFGSPRIRPANDNHVLSIGAVDANLAPAVFSSANTTVDLAAPGVDIPVAVPLAIDTQDGAQDGYGTSSGTSFAAPLTAAATAWLAVTRSDLTASQIGDVLRFSARDINAPGYDEATGFGLVDLAAALVEPAGLADPAEPNDDIEWVDGRHFRRDTPYLQNTNRANFRAALDWEKDGIDVVPVLMPRNTRLQATMSPNFDVDLLAYNRTARRVGPDRGLIAQSRRVGRNVERVTLTNRGPAQVVYLVAFKDGTADSYTATYRMVLNRTRI